ncbi:hypothetical protein [Lichenicoccus sp.]|uniref:hypothetical protein n=1 Tax=Lichenicoccus sp. TaxID=2781899 RepID=UPI003D0EE664
MVTTGETTTTSNAALVLDDRFRILPGVPAGSLAGHVCVAAEDKRGIGGNLVALRTEPLAPPRAALGRFMHADHEAMLSPLAYGAAGGAYWIITRPPPGPSLVSLAAPWRGNGLLTHVLRPAALALDVLQMAGLTHRAIRPDNVFVAAGGKGAVLGPGWAGPPAIGQPASFEPPYSAICAPAARGDGSIADDVYALGVLLLSLWTGEVPLASLAAGEIIRLKLEYGSYAALTQHMRLPRGFDNILRAMLSDDPLARPLPVSLANLDGIHARRGGSRSALRAAKPIAVGGQLAWNRRMLALLCAEQPQAATVMLRERTIEQWLRRSVEDPGLAATVEEFRQEEMVTGTKAGSARTAGNAPPLSDSNLMRLVALLDPLAPLFWRGYWLWPEGAGPALAGAFAQPPLVSLQDAGVLLEDLVLRGGVARWRAARPSRPNSTEFMLPQHLLQNQLQGEPANRDGLLLRATYALNPYLACQSPKFRGESVVDALALVAVLERLGPEKLGGDTLLDAHSFAFLDVRTQDRPREAATEPAAGGVARELAILARCQAKGDRRPLPRIAASLLPRLEQLLQDWPGVSRRQRRLAALRTVAAAGDLMALLGLVSDTTHREQDDAARKHALDEVDAIRSALEEQARTASARLLASRHAARDTASAAGLICVMAALLLKVLS